jgi:hypothetical protein
MRFLAKGNKLEKQTSTKYIHYKISMLSNLKKYNILENVNSTY